MKRHKRFFLSSCFDLRARKIDPEANCFNGNIYKTSNIVQKQLEGEGILLFQVFQKFYVSKSKTKLKYWGNDILMGVYVR